MSDPDETPTKGRVMTKVKRTFMTVCMLVLLSPLAARAASIAAGSIELDTRLSFDHNSVDIDDALPPLFEEDLEYSVTRLEMNAGLGYFLNSRWEILGNLIVDHTGLGGDLDGSFTDFGLIGEVLYHFNTSGSVIPFVGAGLGLVVHGGDVGDDDDDTTIIVPEILGGLRWPFREVVSLNLTGGFRHEESPFGLEDASGNAFFFAFGFSFFLQGGAVE
jgi:hypothetical protein